MHRPVLAPIMVSPLRVPEPKQQETDSFLSLDSPISICQSPLSIAESRRTSRTSYNDLPPELEEDTEQWASYGLHMEHSQRDHQTDEGLVNSDWIDGGEADSPTTGALEAISRPASLSRSPRAFPRFSPVSSQGSSWSSSRRPGAPSVVLSFKSNGQFQLSAPPSKRSINNASSRESSSTLSSNFSYSAAQQIALANKAARLSAAASSSGTAPAESTHRQSSGSFRALEHKIAEVEEQNLTPAQEFIRNIRKKQESRESNPQCWRWEEAIAAEQAEDVQETLDAESTSAAASTRAGSSAEDVSLVGRSSSGSGRIKTTLGKLTGLRRRTRSNVSQGSSLKSELSRGFV